jgi:outer membrane lipoprotein carrier protein
MTRRWALCVLCALVGAAGAAQADGVQRLREFVRDVKSARAEFVQTVSAPDGVRKKTSSGSFEFERPNHFRFTYRKPFAQQIVSDGRKVWIFDADLNQASSRDFATALGATPAALLAGGGLDQDFVLSEDPPRDGLEWALAVPKQADGAFKSVRVGFRGKDLAALEIVDAFDQRSVLLFSQWVAGVTFAPDAFHYTPPPGADVISQ